MKLHRFFIDDTKLTNELEIRDEALLWQWNKVLRFSSNEQLNVFNSAKQEATYQIVVLSKSLVTLQKLKEIKPVLPAREVYLFWSLLKRDNNDLILQKGTELGVRHFIPLIAQRTIKKDFNHERAVKIVIEACEQSGRVDVPEIQEPVQLKEAIEKFKDKVTLYICDVKARNDSLNVTQSVGIFIGPEGGWTDEEQQLFTAEALAKLSLGPFTLRAETAAIVAASKLL